MNILNLEDEKFKTETIQGYKFRLRYISPLDRVNITRERIILQGGQPVEALTADDYTFFENVAIVNTCVDQMPDGFKENESCVKWNEISLIYDVAEAIKRHTADIEAKLKKNRLTE